MPSAARALQKQVWNSHSEIEDIRSPTFPLLHSPFSIFPFPIFPISIERSSFFPSVYPHLHPHKLDALLKTFQAVHIAFRKTLLRHPFSAFWGTKQRVRWLLHTERTRGVHMSRSVPTLYLFWLCFKAETFRTPPYRHSNCIYIFWTFLHLKRYRKNELRAACTNCEGVYHCCVAVEEFKRLVAVSATVSSVLAVWVWKKVPPQSLSRAG